MSTLDHQPIDVGRRGSVERRLVERRAILEAATELALRAARAEIESGWIGADVSPLGVARHVAAVERRLASGSTSSPTARREAAIVAGRYLLTVDAVAFEFFHEPSAPPARDAMRLARALAALSRVLPSNDNASEALP